MDVIDNVLEIPDSVFEASEDQNIGGEILSAVDQLLTGIHNTSDNFTYSGDNIVVAAIALSDTAFPLTAAVGISASSGYDVIDFSGTAEIVNDVPTVLLPASILDIVPGKRAILSLG